MNTYDKEEMKEMSMIEIAFALLKEAKKPLVFHEMFMKVAEAKELSKGQQADRIANLYTDLNVDGRFISVGDNQWGLKKWYPIERIEEEMTAKQSKKRVAKNVDEDDEFDIDLEEEDFEEEDFEEEEIEEDVDVLDEDGEYIEDDEDDEKLDGFVEVEEEDFEEEEEIEEEF